MGKRGRVFVREYEAAPGAPSQRHPGRQRRPGVTRDAAASATGALVFSLALAVASVALPLLALDAPQAKA